MIKNNRLQLFFASSLTLLALLILPGCGKENSSTAQSKKSKKSITQSTAAKSTQSNSPVALAQKKASKEIVKGFLQNDNAEASFDEMLAQIQIDIERGKHLAAAMWLEKIIRRYPDHQDVADFKFKHAECLALGQKFLSASQVYDDFVSKYPGDSRETEAKFLSLTALYNYSKSIAVECDSTETNSVIKVCKNLLGDETMHSKNEQIAGILKHCQERLVNKDVAVFESYIRRDKLEAAATRLAKIKDTYNEQAPELAPRIAYLECKLASATNDDIKARACLELLEDQYAESKYAKMAASYVGNNSNPLFS